MEASVKLIKFADENIANEILKSANIIAQDFSRQARRASANGAERIWVREYRINDVKLIKFADENMRTKSSRV